jgi:UDP-glucose:(glucosyl)LPS alpha-1,2-glucosyltransferase
MTSIDILLPHKEMMTDSNRGAIATVVSELVLNSASPEMFSVFGIPLSNPIKGIDYRPISFYRKWLYGGNLGMAHAYLRSLKSENRNPDLIEVHGRAQVAALIARRRPDLKVVLYLHNDPRHMKGSKTPAERSALLASLAGIFCISEFIKTCFCEALNQDAAAKDKIFIIPNGVARRLTTQPCKQKQVLIAGRMVPEKGILEACRAAASVLPDAPDCDAIASLGRQAVHHGFIPYDEVRAHQEQAAICIVPSLWEEPAGLTVIEALSAGAALITTNRGGIPETATDRAIIVDITAYLTDSTKLSEIFATQLRSLIIDEAKRTALQKKAWKDYPFCSEIMSTKADKVRISVLED